MSRVGGVPGQFIPPSFHEYHWRASLGGFGGGSVASSSRTSIGGASVFSMGGGSGMDDGEFGGEMDENSVISRNWEQTNLGSMLQSNGKSKLTFIHK